MGSSWRALLGIVLCASCAFSTEADANTFQFHFKTEGGRVDQLDSTANWAAFTERWGVSHNQQELPHWVTGALILVCTQSGCMYCWTDMVRWLQIGQSLSAGWRLHTANSGRR
jgi:hypothetical protein